MNTRVNIVTILAIVAALVIAGCTSYQAPNKEVAQKTGETPQQEIQNTTTPTGLSTPENNAAAEKKEVKEFAIAATEFSFTPNSISVKKGDKVKITFKNTGAAPHNFVIDELGITTKVLGSGETEVVEFTADKTGTFKFYCSVDSHRQKGMEGTATIS